MLVREWICFAQTSDAALTSDPALTVVCLQPRLATVGHLGRSFPPSCSFVSGVVVFLQIINHADVAALPSVEGTWLTNFEDRFLEGRGGSKTISKSSAGDKRKQELGETFFSKKHL